MSRPFRGGVKRPAADMLGESVESPPIIKSPLDKREYRGLTLDNKMRVILISDSLTDKAAVSLSVAAGELAHIYLMITIKGKIMRKIFWFCRKYERPCPSAWTCSSL